MKYTINNKIYSVGMAVMLILCVFVVVPSISNASYHSCDYDCAPVTPIYAYNSPQYSALRVSCYSQPTSAFTGDSILWMTSVYGGTGSYNMTWTGTEGLSGIGTSIMKAYNNSGSKSATVTVISGNQTVSQNCDNSVVINERYNYNNNNNNYNYNNYNYYSPLSVSCSANTTYTNTGNSISWTSYPSGGNGNYSYTWSGTDGLSGSGQSAYMTYYNSGYKYGSVTVYSNGQSITQSCSNSVNVTGSYNYNYNGYNNYNYSTGYVVAPTYVVNNQNTLDIGCYADPATIRVNQPSTWSVEVTGGIAPYTYTWTGSDGLSGAQASVIKYYSTVGEKNAIVTVTSADGKTGSRTCTNTVTVRGAGTGYVAPTTPSTNVNSNTTNDNGLSAAALFSLKYVPWGWVAVLIILVLFATVMYLLFNRTKI